MFAAHVNKRASEGLFYSILFYSQLTLLSTPLFVGLTCWELQAFSNVKGRQSLTVFESIIISNKYWKTLFKVLVVGWGTCQPLSSSTLSTRQACRVPCPQSVNVIFDSPENLSGHEMKSVPTPLSPWTTPSVWHLARSRRSGSCHTATMRIKPLKLWRSATEMAHELLKTSQKCGQSCHYLTLIQGEQHEEEDNDCQMLSQMLTADPLPRPPIPQTNRRTQNIFWHANNARLKAIVWPGPVCWLA